MYGNQLLSVHCECIAEAQQVCGFAPAGFREDFRTGEPLPPDAQVSQRHSANGVTTASASIVRAVPQDQKRSAVINDTQRSAQRRPSLSLPLRHEALPLAFIVVLLVIAVGAVVRAW
jgi:hypothetical protein